ncbi:hypothetical protein AB0L06_35455 [Spirillospora sp. NPDC052269]
MSPKNFTAVTLTGAAVVGLGALSSPPSGTWPSVPAPFTVPATERGSLVKAEHLRGLSVEEVRTVLGQGGFDATTVKHGVEAYRLTYRTVDTKGAAATATGLFVVPQGKRGRLTPVSYTHGTISYKPDAPSVSITPWAVGPAYTYAGSGFAAVLPDYLGLGEGPGAHPWKDVPSETSASLDMLRAARAFAPRTGHSLDRDVLITGFSQGASSALGLARTLQDGTDPHFRVKAVAPISGAYDLAGAELRTDGEVCKAWTPRMTVRFYKAEADEQATTLNTDHCVASLRERGVDPQVENLGKPLYQGSLHLGTNVAGTGKIVHWFSSMAA